jgi:hypothetical protein
VRKVLWFKFKISGDFSANTITNGSKSILSSTFERNLRFFMNSSQNPRRFFTPQRQVQNVTAAWPSEPPVRGRAMAVLFGIEGELSATGIEKSPRWDHACPIFSRRDPEQSSFWGNSKSA